MARSNSERVNCQLCQHYRPQVSFVDAWKRGDMNPPRGPIMKSLQEVRKAETEALENEVELLFELVRGEVLDWPNEPRFAPYCNADGKIRVAALKNQGGRCSDFTPAVSRDDHACQTCTFMTSPLMKIGDRHESLQGWMSQGHRDHVIQQNKEKEDSEASALGLEIEQSFHSDGQLPVVSFLSTCGAKRTGGRYHVPPFCNLRSQCLDHSPNLRVPVELMDERAESIDERAMDLSLDIMRIVAAAGADPGRGAAALRDWLAGDRARTPAAGWIKRGLARWHEMTPFDRGIADAIPPPHGTMLLPFVAGADMFEWGWLAATSWSNPETSASVAVQQISEFSSSMVRPLEAAASIDAARRVLAEPAFNPATKELLHRFLRRIETTYSDLWHLARTDLIAYYEVYASSLSYSVGKWLRAEPAGGSASGVLGDAIASAMLDSAMRRLATARAEGEAILDRLAKLGDATATPLPAAFLDQLTRANASAVEAEAQEMKDMFHGTLARFGLSTESSGGLPDMQKQVSALFGLPQVDTDPINVSVERTFGPIRNVELPRRRLMAWLILRRGTLPVTPSALEFVPGAVPSKWIPTHVVQALTQPASKNLEAMFAAPAVDALVSRCRRLPSPRLATR